MNELAGVAVVKKETTIDTKDLDELFREIYHLRSVNSQLSIENQYLKQRMKIILNNYPSLRDIK